MSDQHSQAGPSREGYGDGGHAPGEDYLDPAIGRRGPFAAEQGPTPSRPGPTRDGGAVNPGTWRDPLPGGPADGGPGAWPGAFPGGQGRHQDGYPADPLRDGPSRPDPRRDGYAQPAPGDLRDGRGAEPAVDALGLPITPLAAERHAPPHPGGPAPLEPRHPAASSASAAYDAPQAALDDQRDVRPLADAGGPPRDGGNGVWHDDPEATIVTSGNGPQEGLRTLVELARAAEGHTDGGQVGDGRPGEGRPDDAYDLPPLDPSADQARQGGQSNAYEDVAPYPSEDPARFPTRTYSSSDPLPPREGSSSVDSYPPREGSSSLDSYPPREGSSSLDSYPPREGHSSLDQYPQSFDAAPHGTRDALPYLGGQSPHGLEPRDDSAHPGPDRGPGSPVSPHHEAAHHEALRPETPPHPAPPDAGDRTLRPRDTESGHGRAGEAGPEPATLHGTGGQADASPYAPPADAPMGEVAALAEQFAQRFDLLAQNVERIIKGKRQTVELALVCLFAEGHLLIEDVPGTGKTTLARSIAASVDGLWRHIRFTPDLEPADVIGVPARDEADGTTGLRRGPVFANLVLCDGIEHAAPKTLAALLEAMEERRVVVDSEPHALPRPFMVIATQDSVRDPAYGDGPPALPKARLDRFLMRISVGYPDPAAEVEALKGMPAGPQVDRLPLVARASDIAGMIDFITRIHVADPIYDYMVSLVAATRDAPETRLGASPRAGMALLRASRVRAAAAGRHYVVPEDVRALAVPVLAHRLMLTPEAEARGHTGASVVEEVVARVPAPQLAGV